MAAHTIGKSPGDGSEVHARMKSKPRVLELHEDVCGPSGNPGRILALLERAFPSGHQCDERAVPVGDSRARGVCKECVECRPGQPEKERRQKRGTRYQQDRARKESPAGRQPRPVVLLRSHVKNLSP